MHRVYEIFEVWPDGSTVKRAVVSGLEFAKVMLDALAKRTSHECMAADAETHQVVAQRNVPRAKGRAVKRIFQIAYDEGIGFRRAQLLRELGYGVISVLGTIQFTGMVFCQAADTRSHIAVSIHPSHPSQRRLRYNPRQSLQNSLS